MCGAAVTEFIEGSSEGSSSPEHLSAALLPGSEMYSIIQIGGAWLVEIFYDNLLHAGEGETEHDAVRTAIAGITDVAVE